MKVKQAIKKVVALAAGAGIVGATLAGAMAQDLSTYPQPFVQNGVFSDSVIVVGEAASPSDVLGAIEIAASLQAAAYSVRPVEVSGITSSTATAGVKIQKGGNEFNIGEDIYDIDTEFTADDMEDILEDGTYSESKRTKNTEDYEQKLAFTDGNAQLVFGPEDDDPEKVDFYLHLVDSPLYTYTLEFNDYVSFDPDEVNDEFEGSTIKIQGNTYTITEAGVDGNDELDELTLMAGETVRWMQQDQPLTVGDNTIMIVNVDENGFKCGVEVDGVMRWVDVGSTETFGSGDDAITIGVLDAVTVHSKDYDQDTCEISIGSMEIELDDGQEIKVGGTTVEGATVAFTNSDAGEWTGFTITYEPEDDIFVAPNGAWSDPVFGNWKLQFAGMAMETETLTVATTANKGTFKFLNVEGLQVEMQTVDDNTDLGWGFNKDFLGMVFDGNDDETTQAMLMNNSDYCDGVTDADECAGIRMLVVSSGHEARVIEITNIDEDAEKVKVKDITKGTATSDWKLADGSGLVDVGFTSIDLEVDGDNHLLIANEIVYGDIKTKNEAILVLETVDSDSVRVTLSEDEGGNAPATDVVFTIDLEDEDQEVTPTAPLYGMYDSEQDSDIQKGATAWGTVLTWDSEDKDDLSIVYPVEQAYGEVFLTPLSAEIISGGAGAVNAEKINAIPVGMGKLDKDAEALTKNMIVVGGPCVNTIAAELAGNPADCAEGYEAGKAKIKMYTRKGKAALLVAGYSAQDSLGAAYVLADYDNEAYDLSGSEVEVVVASLTDIDVTSVQ